MNMEFEILKAKPKIWGTLTRDSVCAGDDGDAPHEKRIEVHSFTDPEIFARAVLTNYLPSVAAIGHSWICILNGVRIAEITTTRIRSLVVECPFSTENHVYLEYHSATF